MKCPAKPFTCTSPGSSVTLKSTGFVVNTSGRECQWHKRESRRQELLGGGGDQGHAPRKIFEIGLSETPFSAFPGPDLITYDRNDHSFPIV